METTDTSNTVQLEELFRSQHARVLAYVLGRVKCEATALDITATVFEAAVREVNNKRAMLLGPGWLITVARRRVVDHWRHAAAERSALARLAPEHAEARPPDDVVASSSGVESLLRVLPDNQHRAVVERHLAGASIDEVAATLGRSYKATESLLGRARATLRANGDAHLLAG